jgi:S-adenosylmethionine:tRNA ribosyltransferase-isomerase
MTAGKACLAAMSELDQYDYELPRHLIAQFPLAHRADARLLVVDRATKSLAHKHVRDLPEILLKGDCLVLNDARVVPARLIGYRTATRGHWEGLFVESSPEGFWKVVCKTRGRLSPGESITLINAEGIEDIRLILVAQQPEGAWIVRPESSEDVYLILERVGRVPLPPYIRKGEMVASDRQAYQTVYAKTPGAVAAPTAGLHFTTALLQTLKSQGVDVCFLTLRVGLGTFRPILSETLAEHRMHAEWGQVTAEAIAKIKLARHRGGRVVAVGTTTVRLLETAARDGELQPFEGMTDLFIRPPFQFRVVDALMTNFHLPRTTLLVLVRTFGGDELIRRAYDEAIREEYRFYSYGDAMLIL